MFKSIIFLMIALLRVPHSISGFVADLKDCGVSKAPPAIKSRIVGGTDAVSEFEFPWQVSIQRKSFQGKFTHHCGGTLLNEEWVITAAHCIDRFLVSSVLKVYVGARNINTPLQTHNVVRMWTHFSFNSVTMENDIALLKLAEPINITASEGRVNGICLPPGNQIAEDNHGPGVVAGWGSTREDKEVMSSVLKYVEVDVMDPETCQTAYPRMRTLVKESMLCAGSRSNKGGKDSCQGDSGGPLIQWIDGRAHLIGIVSWGVGCGRRDIAGGYTRVSYFLDWIRDTIQRGT